MGRQRCNTYNLEHFILHLILLREPSFLFSLSPSSLPSLLLPLQRWRTPVLEILALNPAYQSLTAKVWTVPVSTPTPPPPRRRLRLLARLFLDSPSNPRDSTSRFPRYELGPVSRRINWPNWKFGGALHNGVWGKNRSKLEAHSIVRIYRIR